MFEADEKRGQLEEERIDELLSAYLDGMLTADEQAQLEARLERDPALRARLQGLRLTVRSLSALPQVALPRNFILSPAMVKDKTPRPTARPRALRRSWPIFGWATAIATLLLVFVVAGDVFLVAPVARPELKEAAVEIAPPETEMEQEMLSVAQAPTGVPDAAQEMLEEAEEAAPAMMAETPQDEREGLPPATVAMGGGDELPEPELSAATAPRAETEQAAASEEAPAGESITDTAQIEKQVFGTPEPGTAIPRMAARPTPEKTDGGDPGPHPLQEQAATAASPERAGAEAVADEGVSVWLRLAEGGLALLVVALAVTTWVIRRREV